ncbi:glycosyltransferase family 39 protein [Streptacidiphilus fuscans]|uniref:Glycosyltransferase family 39 protein n=1 Tax=Streptacidiphilus fuscans TaxID=2789292 RepID=A0A931B061_9ACTN|nr:glycosyltransferase family 39 protein [Streptacidiphilus fuscans]MBF9068725.1 glycosyltransferase family 39 protein [Streptacidiphilus fuscans]
MSTSLSEPLPSGAPSHDPGKADEPGRPVRGWRRLLFGSGSQPRWVRPAFWGLLLVTAVLYLWGLGASGNANSFYAASVWAGTKSWKALFFAALDPSNAITVDKPPAALWVMALSGRIFGFNSWSMLVPQALEGVLAVGLLYSAVRRWFGPAAGLIGGFVLAFTPVAALMFRFNNPDAMLVLLMVLACWAMVRAVENGRVRWVVLAGAAVGFAFLAKMMQGYVIIPALALAYLWAAPVSLGKRFLHMLWGALAIVVSTGWFVLAVALWPASSRPFIGGSSNNSEWQLAIGYNGLGRVFGGDGNPSSGGGGAGPGGGGGASGMFGGATGITRMFSSTFGGEISWLLPTALIALVALLVFAWRAPRTDRVRAAALLWGGWLVVNGVLFSFMSGIIHPYYTVAIAPPIAALVGIGAAEMWRRRDDVRARTVLALMTAAAGVWAFVLLDRDASWLPWLRWAVLVLALAGAAALVAVAQARRAMAVTAVVVSLVGGLGGGAAWAVATASQPHSGSIPTSGPSGAGGAGGFGGGMPGGGQGGASAEMRKYIQETFGGRAGGTGGSGGASSFGGGMGGPDGGTANSALVKLLKSTNTRWAAATVGSQQAASLELTSYKAVMAMGGFSGSDNSPTLAQFEQYVAQGEIHYLIAGGGMSGGTSGSATGGTSGGGRSTGGSTGTAGSTGLPGSGGSNAPGGATSGAPSRTASGEFPGGPGGFPGGEGGFGETRGGSGGLPGGAAGGAGGGAGGMFGGTSSNQISQIESWVKAHYKAITVGGQTVYDLTQPKS